MLTMPVLAAGGEKSFGPMMAAVMRAAASNVQTAVVSNSGHWVMEENPAATIKLVEDFLKGRATKSATVALKLRTGRTALRHENIMPRAQAGIGAHRTVSRAQNIDAGEGALERRGRTGKEPARRAPRRTALGRISGSRP